MPGTISHLSILCSVFLLVQSLSAQVYQFELELPNPIPLAQLSDIDGDGIPEYLAQGLNAQGVLSGQIYSIAREEVLVEWATLDTDGMVLSGLGDGYDLNGDGFFDVVFAESNGLTGEAELEARDGRTGAVLWHRSDFHLPARLLRTPAAIGDRNGDGVIDFVQPIAGGEVVHFSGADGTTLQRNPSGFFNAADEYTKAGDLDRDGIPDYFAQFFFSTWAFSGATDQILFSIPIVRILESLAYVGDTNGDGFDDFAYYRVGANGEAEPMEIWTGSGPVKLGEIPGHHPGENSHAFPILHYDWDGDGTQDLVSWGLEGSIPYSSPAPPYFRIHSFSRGEDLVVLPVGHVPSIYNHTFVYFQEDYDGDSKPDPIYGTNSQGGLVDVVSLKEHLTANVPSISQSAGGVIDFTVDVTPRFAFHDGLLLVGVDGRYTGNEVFNSSEFWLKFGVRYELALPFGRALFTNQIWRLRGSGRSKESRFTLTFDAMGQGHLTLAIAPGEIPLDQVGHKLKFAFLLPDVDDPQFPEGTTEAVAIEVLP
ncbi:MAG: hypothetical protein QM477_01325 [Planctomycetota bacterium]